MKTIFIFRDSRATDPRPCIAALGEDAGIFARVEFAGGTQDHVQYAFGCTHTLPFDIRACVSEPLNSTRTGLFAAYDRAYGAGNWIPLWLDAPETNAAWRKAMQQFRSRQSQSCIGNVPFSDAGLARILDAIANAPDMAANRVVH